MKIELAVYTAVKGYDWQPGTVYDKKQLDIYLAVLRGFGSQNNTSYAKIFVHEDRVVFARFFIAEGIEQYNRPATYIILGTVEINRANEIDFMQLLSMEEISKPVPAPFPSVMDYKGVVAQNIIQLDGACRSKGFRGVDILRSLGICAQKAESLSVDVSKDGEEVISFVTYEPRPTQTLAQRMVLNETVLKEVFSLFDICGNEGVSRQCQNEHSFDSIPSSQLSKEIEKCFSGAVEQIKNLRRERDGIKRENEQLNEKITQAKAAKKKLLDENEDLRKDVEEKVKLLEARNKKLAEGLGHEIDKRRNLEDKYYNPLREKNVELQNNPLANKVGDSFSCRDCSPRNEVKKGSLIARNQDKNKSGGIFLKIDWLILCVCIAMAAIFVVLLLRI